MKKVILLLMFVSCFSASAFAKTYDFPAKTVKLVSKQTGKPIANRAVYINYTYQFLSCCSDHFPAPEWDVDAFGITKDGVTPVFGPENETWMPVNTDANGFLAIPAAKVTTQHIFTKLPAVEVESVDSSLPIRCEISLDRLSSAQETNVGCDE